MFSRVKEANRECDSVCYATMKPRGCDPECFDVAGELVRARSAEGYNIWGSGHRCMSMTVPQVIYPEAANRHGWLIMLGGYWPYRMFALDRVLTLFKTPLVYSGLSTIPRIPA